MFDSNVWRDKDLEDVHECPWCGKASYIPELTDVLDYSFRTSGDRWQFNRCNSCSSLVLSPRPTKDTIALAYERYYTRSRSKFVQQKPKTAYKRFRRAMRNSFVHKRFGWDVHPRLPLGWLFVSLVPPLVRHWDRSFRRLPRKRGRLLDIGCGSGAFLERASKVGWSCVGVDFDSKCAANDCEAPWEFHTTESFDISGENQKFDHITLHHLIEHVHDPIQLLAGCYEMLKPGGSIWIETPSSQGGGLYEFGKYWRGLEAPRHLTLASPKQLINALNSLGFVRIERLSFYDPTTAMAKISMSYREQTQNWSGNNPNHAIDSTFQVGRSVMVRVGLREQEFICINAFKSD